MRIALNHRHFRPHGGVERYLWTFARKLVNRGHDVHVFCSKSASPAPDGVTIHIVPLTPLGESIKAMSFARNSRKLLRIEEFDGVLGFGKTIYGDVYRDGSGCMKHFGKYQRTHESGVLGNAGHALSVKQAVFRRLERLRFRRGAFGHIVTISGMVRDQILSLYDVPESGITVIYPGVDTDVFRLKDRETCRAEVRAEYRISDDEALGITIANGFLRKGIEPLLEALSLIGGGCWRFIVLGKDKHLGRYRVLTDGLGLGDRVHLCGWRKDVESHLAASDFFVLNSRFDAFGNSTMEAMASGLPCVVSAKAGSSEMVRDGENGFVVSDPDNVEELSEAMKKLVVDRGLRERLGECALETARGNTIDTNVDEYLAILERLRS